MEIDENDLFYFESDHVAIKGNKDYSELLKTIVVLEAQKTKAIQVRTMTTSLSHMTKKNIYRILKSY